MWLTNPDPHCLRAINNNVFDNVSANGNSRHFHCTVNLKNVNNLNICDFNINFDIDY